MKRRTKNNSEYWNRRLLEMFKEFPQSEDVRYRYNSIRHLLLKQYPQLKEISRETLLLILKDTSYLERQLRLFTEGKQTQLKKELSDEKIVELKS